MADVSYFCEEGFLLEKAGSTNILENNWKILALLSKGYENNKTHIHATYIIFLKKE